MGFALNLYSAYTPLYLYIFISIIPPFVYYSLYDQSNLQSSIPITLNFKHATLLGITHDIDHSTQDFLQRSI